VTDRLISLRVDSSTVKAADRLIPSLSKVTEIAATGKVTRSVVLRLALARGLEALKADYGRGAKKRGRGR